MEKQTVFIKVKVSDRLPKEGCVLTPSGYWLFHGGKFRCPHDGTIQQGIYEWLEEIELPSEDEIEQEEYHNFIQSDRNHYFKDGFRTGADFILNHLKSNTNETDKI